jgi:transcriptional regulator with XRE-family HTH domain
MTYGEKIVNMRKENNLTQEQFAELLSVSRQAVSKWESCSSFPDTEKLIRMSKLFSCSVDYLLKDEIENKDINETQESDKVKKNYILGVILTYLSFPPIFGFVVGIFSIVHQMRTIHNRKMMLISIIGSIISLILTTIMMIGFVLEL